MKQQLNCVAATAIAVIAAGSATAIGPHSHKVSTDKPGLKSYKPVKRDFSQGNTLFVVPYAHLDTQWRWAYPQVIREFIANTLRLNFALIEKYPHYVFNFSGSRRYEMMKEYYPAEYAKLKEYIKAGRWFPCGSSVDENDANVPSGESLVRHVLYGNHYFKREFGVVSQEFMLPDCFGFPYALPSVLNYCGIKGFSTQKLTWGSAVGIPFKVGTWEGPDGKSIVAALDPGSYGGGVDEDLSQNTSWLARIQNTGKQSNAYVDYHYYGTGDTGGSPSDSAVAWVEKSIAGKGPISVVSAHADEMFTSLKPEQIAKLPHYKGELLLTEHSAGSITSQAYMKRWNRKNELLADAAEKASVAAMWLGGTPYPAKRLYDAWDLVLGSQMHDMLPGTSIPKAYEFCWNDELLAQNQFAAVEQDAVGVVASAMDTSAKGCALLVYNPLSIAREDVVEATVPLTKAIQVYGPKGSPVPTQVISKNANGSKVLFLAQVPSTGFASFDAREVVSPATSQLRATERTLESSKFRVTINDAGDIASVYDKTNKREVLKAPARLEFHYRNPAQFPAWNMDWNDAKNPARGYVSGPAKICIVENGPVRVALEIERESDGSKFVQQVRLSAGSGQIEVANKIDWQTKETALKASFPLADGNPLATYDLALGAIERGNNNEKKYEVPQHQWLDVSKADGSYGVGLLNDCKYGSDKPDDNTVRLTMIYTPGVRGGYEDQYTQDFGKHDILYALAPHTGDWRKGGVAWAAKRLNQPLRAFIVPAHPGKLGKTFSLVTISNPQVELQALKKAEDGNGIIVRLRELAGKPARRIQIRAAAPIASASEVNGQEARIGTASVVDGAIVADISGFSLRSFELQFAAEPVAVSPVKSVPVSIPFDADVASADSSPGDGAFDSAGRTLAAEQLPKILNVGGVVFSLGTTGAGAKNGLTARGQKLALPSGYQRVYLLAASSEGDIASQFTIGKKSYAAVIQDWGGYVGQWDNRLWAMQPGPNFTNYGQMTGLMPGYVKRGEVAWFSSHRHNPSSGNEFYQYSYLYKYGFDIPAAGASITLPNDPRIKVLAVSVAKNVHGQARAAAPLSDDLSHHSGNGAPTINPGGGEYSDVTTVEINPPLYWRASAMHYTLDGSEPTAASPTYSGPLSLNDPVTVKAAQVASDGTVGPIATAKLQISDKTAPSVMNVSSTKSLGLARVKFSEKVTRESAEATQNYAFSSGAKVASARLAHDERSVELTLESPLPAGQSERLTVRGVRDLSKSGNANPGQTLDVTEHGAVFTSPVMEPKTSKTFQINGLPVKAGDAWTLNLFCKIDVQPEDRVIIAGFGRAVAGRTGTGRYFTKFRSGINMWADNKDVITDVPLDTGKWQMLTATYDGETMRLYKNGKQIAEEKVELADDQSRVQVMPLDAWERQRKFNGEVRDLTIWDQDLSPEGVMRLWEAGKP